MNKHRTQNQELLEELNRNLKETLGVEVLSVNNKNVKEETLRSINSHKKRLEIDALDKLQRAVNRYDSTIKNIDEKVEKPYRQKVIEKLTDEFITSVGKKTFWNEYTQADRVKVWNRISEQVKSMKLDEIISYC